MKNKELFEKTFGFKLEENAECPIPAAVCEKVSSDCEYCPFHHFWDMEYKGSWDEVIEKVVRE